jgi:enoyl-CoA hydratase/carnithine racemase
MSTDDHGIRVERDGAIARITIDRTDEMNMLSRSMLDVFLALTDELRDDDDVHVVVITGAGSECFCTGVLNPTLRGELSKPQVLDVVLTANRLFDSIEALPQVVIAAVNGVVRAGGVELLLACDFKVAVAHATLAMPEARWGGFPGAGGPARLTALVGHGRAIELICTGREIDTGEMLRYGLVEEVVPSAGLAQAVDAVAGRIASSGPLAVRGTKRIMSMRREPGFHAARELSIALRRSLEYSQDVDEGIAAHRENRAPRFTGR